MWAVVGVWQIDPDVIEEFSGHLPAMAEGKLALPGFVHGTWTRDGHVVQVYADEASARRYYDDMRAAGVLERPGVRCLVFDVSEVAAESDARIQSD